MFASDLGELFNATACKGTQFIRSVSSTTTLGSDFLRMAPSTAVVSPLTCMKHSGISHQGEPKLSSSPSSVPAASGDSSGCEQMHHRSDHPCSRADDRPIPTSVPTMAWSRPPAPVNQLIEPESSSASFEHGIFSSTVSQQTQSTAPVPRGILRCPFCDKSFSNSSAIAKHKLTHSEERKYVCSICHKAFKRQDHLNGHKYTHEAKKPHGCCFCDKSYSDARSLRRHYENAHPVEYERWVALSQATNGDTTAIAAAAAALLSSSSTSTTTGLDPDVLKPCVTGNSALNVSACSSTTLLHALSNPVCKLFASLSRPDGSPTSSTTNEGQSSNGPQPKLHRLKENRHRRKSRPRGTEWSSAGSSHSSDSGGGSVSNATSPSAMIMDVADQDGSDERVDKSNPLVALSSITAEDISTAAKVALLMAHPLEAPKRVACAICQKRFKNQSALNGHMRLHGGYGPAGLNAPSSSAAPVNAKLIVSRSGTTLDTHCNTDEASQNIRTTAPLDQPSSCPSKSQGRSDTTALLSGDVSTVFSLSNPIVHDAYKSANRISLCTSQNATDMQANEVTFLPHSHASLVSTRTDDSWLASTHPSVVRPMRHRALPQVPPVSSHSNQFADSHPTQPQPPLPPCYPLVHRDKSSAPLDNAWLSGFLDDHLCFPGRDGCGPRSPSDPNLHSAATICRTSSCSDLPKPVNSEPLQRACVATHPDRPGDQGSLKPPRATSASVRRENLSGSSVIDPKTYDVATQRHPVVERERSSGHIWSGGQSAEQRALPYASDMIAHLGFVTEPHINTESHMTAIITAHSSDPVGKPEIHVVSNSTSRPAPIQPEWSSVPRSGPETCFPFNIPTATRFCPQTGFSDQYSPVTPSQGNTAMAVDNVNSSDNTAFHFPPQEHHLPSGTELRHYLNATHLSDPVIPASVAPQMTYTESALPPAKWNRELGKMYRFTVACQSGSTGKLDEFHFGRSSTCSCQGTQTSSSVAPDSLVDILDSLNHRSHMVGTHQVATVTPVGVSRSQHGDMTNRIPHSTVGDAVTNALFNSTWSRSNGCQGVHAFGQASISDSRIPIASVPHPYPTYMGASVSVVPTGLDSHYVSSGSSSSVLHESHSFPNTYHSRSFDSFYSVAVHTPHSHAVNRSSRPNAVTYLCDRREPERTRHISAPVMQPSVFTCSSSISHSTSRSGGSLSHLITVHGDMEPSSYGCRGCHNNAPSDASDITAFSTTDRLDTTASDAVADLLMQSHITDTFTVSEPSSLHLRQDNDAVFRPLQIDADYANQTHAYNVRSTGVVTTSMGSTFDVQSHTFQHSGAHSIPVTSMCSSNEYGTSASAVEEFELADLATGSTGSVDDRLDSQLTVSQLSKSLAEDNLFRNPHTLPPPKKQKRKPAPIFIPPQTGANLSRLRSPRVWTSDGSSTNPSPPPYTPPPMLSPNRPGSGLFSSLTKWSSTVSPVRSGVLFSRRNSSYCPLSAASVSGDFLRRRSNQTRVHPLTTCNESEGTSLKRSYTSSFVRCPNTQTMSSTYSSRDSVDEHNRVFAFSSRRHQATPNSAPVLMLDSSGTAVAYSEHASDPSCPQPVMSQATTTTVFGYDDETMRRFAEADAADRARCRQTHRDELSASSDLPECLSTSLDEVPEKLSKLEQSDSLMNYQSNEALVLVEDTLSVLDEHASETDQYIDEDQLLEEEEEGVPSSLVPRINIGEAFQAEIPDLSTDRASYLENTESRETLLWYPANLDEKDPKNIESLNLLMKIACSPAVRSCGLNMEYTFHLLCKYKGNLEMTLHALLYETLVVYDYVYAETTAWTTEEIVRFQHGLRTYGRDFHQIAKDLQAVGMNKTVKACVEFYYAWKRMNTPSDVKWYREKARRQRQSNRSEPAPPLKESSFQPENTQPPRHRHVPEATTTLPERMPESSYNLRRKHTQPPVVHAPVPMNEDRPAVTETFVKEDVSMLQTQPLTSSSDLAEPGTVFPNVLQSSQEKLTGSFPCHLCQRVFAKVKSRNAHMKSHTDRVGVAHHRTPTNHKH